MLLSVHVIEIVKLTFTQTQVNWCCICIFILHCLEAKPEFFFVPFDKINQLTGNSCIILVQICIGKYFRIYLCWILLNHLKKYYIHLEWLWKMLGVLPCKLSHVNIFCTIVICISECRILIFIWRGHTTNHPIPEISWSLKFATFSYVAKHFEIQSHFL